jgi:hypothetical protein
VERTETIRAAAWAVMLLSTGFFLLRVRGAASEVTSGLQLAIATLPFQIACMALLVLFWVGPFPSSWPLIGNAKRGALFWVAVALLSLFWAYFYAVFVFA